MSVEPTCNYCGATDKFRCRTKEEADKCKGGKTMILPDKDRDNLPKLVMSKDLGDGTISIETHYFADSDQVALVVSYYGQESCVKMSTTEAYKLALMIQKVVNYLEQGKL